MQGPIALLARSVAAVDGAPRRMHKVRRRQKVTLVHTRDRSCRRPRTGSGRAAEQDAYKAVRHAVVCQGVRAGGGEGEEERGG
jgi:hypothetical protein